MKILKVLLIIVVLIVAVLAIFIATKEGSYEVERSVIVSACKTDVADYSTNFRRWEEWTPWAAPGQATYEYSDNQSTNDAWYTWTSDNDSIGSGRIDVTTFEEGLMKFDMHFITPFESNSTGHVKWEKVDDGFKVSWGSEGTLPLIARLFVDASDIAEQIGGKFDEGLANMKVLVEALPTPDIKPESRKQDGFQYIGKRMTINVKDLTADLYASTFGAIMAHMAQNGIDKHESLMPLALFHEFNDETLEADMEIAIPVSGNATAPEGYAVGEFPAGKVLVGTHVGSYDSTGDVWEAMGAYLECNGIEVQGVPYEMYMTDPADEPDVSKWVVEIVYPVAD